MDEEKAKWKKKIKKERSRRKRMGEAGGMAMGRGRAGLKDGVFTPAPHDFILPHPRPTSHDRKNFLAQSPSLGAP